MNQFYSKIKIRQQFYLLYFLFMHSLFSFAQVSTNNWYVGNTQAGEWIKYKKVWLSAGDYRFTVQGVASEDNQKVHLQVGGQTFKSVVVPANSSFTFVYTHLGHARFSEGYYDIKLFFDTGNVNCDMIFIRKDGSDEKSFTDNDIKYTISNKEGMKIAPIGAPDFSSGLLVNVGQQNADDIFWDKNKQRYSQEQVFAWNKQQIYAYTPPFTDQAMDIWVSEIVASKANYIFMHGRGQNDYTNEIDDRDYVAADGNFDPRYLTRFVSAVNRSVYAKGNIKLAYFQDNVNYANVYKSKTGLVAKWGDVAFQEFLWKYAFKPWYTYVPKDMLYKQADGKVPVQIWTAVLNDYDYAVQGNEILECLEYVKQKMITEFNLEPAYILDKTFFLRDARTKLLADGIQSWFTWSGGISSMNTFNDKKFAFTVNGKRYPLKLTWYNDWNPVTNTGTAVSPEKGDYHSPAILEDGTAAIRPIFEQGELENAESLVLESWSDWKEGTTLYRSEHPEYGWPNQYISILREYADRNSESIVLEAEDCDEFYDLSIGNSGGTYRVHWYDKGAQVDLDIYRPMHNLVNKSSVGKPAASLVNFSAGFHDLWGFNATGNIYCHEVDGFPIDWSTISRPLQVKDLSVGRYYAWSITKDAKVMKTQLPLGWADNGCSEWIDVTDGKPMKDIDLNLKEVWAVNEEGDVFYRDLDGANKWTMTSGKLSSITVDDNFVWGFNLSGEIVCKSSHSNTDWKVVPNPYKLTKIEAGGGELWGVGADQEIYRIDASGDGVWQYVTKGSNVSVGFEFAWILDSSGEFQKYKLEGFETKSVFSGKTYIDPVKNPNTPPVVIVFPNPSSGNFNVKVSGYLGSTIVISLYDAAGKRIINPVQYNYEQDKEFQIRIERNLSQGIYFLEVKGEKVKRVVKLVIR
jgi:hypothetical protein